MELTEKERARLRELVEEAREDEPSSEVLASLTAKLTAGGGPSFAKYSELLEPAGDPDREVLAHIRTAVESSGRVGIRYVARSGETTERVVRPFNIHFYDGREYLEAFCELRGADRVFAIGNIEAILPVETVNEPGAIEST